jgi:Domain of unknown function (DUF4129)
MSFRWRDDTAPLASSCALESLWLAAVVAALTRHPAALLVLISLVLVSAGAAVARGYRFAHLGRIGAQALSVAVAWAAAGLLYWAWAPRGATVYVLFGHGVGWLVFASAAVLQGLSVGRADSTPDDLMRRVARVLVLVFLVLLVAAAAGRPLPSAGPLVVAAVLLAVLTLVVGRLVAVLAISDRARGRSAWYWVAAVVLLVGVVLIAAATLAGALRPDVVVWPFRTLLLGLRYVLAAAGLVIGYAAATVIRAVVWFAHLLGLHRHSLPARTPVTQPTPSLSPTPAKMSKHLAAVGRAVAIAVITLGVLLVAAMAVVAGVRRFRRLPVEAQTEERQSLVSMGDAVRAAGGRARDALRRLVRRRETGLLAPAQALRREYRLLERALARGGRWRPPGTTARAFLAGLSAATAETGGALAGLYDRARYSRQGVTADDVDRFRGLVPALLEQLGPPAG